MDAPKRYRLNHQRGAQAASLALTARGMAIKKLM
jgi:hypothetical protein